MRKLSREETVHIEVKNGKSVFSERIISEAESIDVGESILVDIDDFAGAIFLGAHILNSYFKKHGSSKRFRMRTLRNHKGWVFVRTE